MTSNFEIYENRIVGEGVLGTLYAARQPSTHRRVIITLLRDEFGRDPGFAGRFHREIAQASRVFHPNVVRTFGSGLWRGRLFHVTEQVNTPSLEERIRMRTRFTLDEILQL